MKNCMCGATALLGLLLLAGCATGRGPTPIAMDGRFADWTQAAPAAEDARGDARPNEVDFGAVRLADDGRSLYLKLDAGRETLLQDREMTDVGNDIRIFLDGDASAQTGEPIDGLGVDLEVHLGARSAVLGSTLETLSLNEVGAIGMPTHTAREFEIEIPFNARPGFDAEIPIIQGERIRLFIQDYKSGDRVPDRGYIEYTLSGQTAAPPAPIAFERENLRDVRVLVHNVERSSPANTPGPFARYLKAFRPDIINFQEVRAGTWSDRAILDFVEAALPPAAGERWHLARVSDCVTLSRWPIRSEGRVFNNLVCLIDLPDRISARDVVIFNAHTPCCGNNLERDREHDAIAATWRDLMAGKGPFAIRPGDAVMMLGDFNMVGYARQLYSLRDGDIHDNDRWGPDFRPGRAKGSLAEAPLRHSHTRDYYTWRDDSLDFTPGKLDFIFFSGDAMKLKRNFALWTPDTPKAALDKWGLLREDSLASDHLALIADFEFVPAPDLDSRIGG